MKKLFVLLFYAILLACVSECMGAVSITPSTLPTLYVNHPFSQQVVANGGARPFTWATYGTLPSGLSLTTSTSQNALLSGTPTTTGVYTFTIQATDASSNVGRTTYTTTVVYDYLTVNQMTDIWTRSTPTAPYIFDTWNSLATQTQFLTVTGSGATTVTSGTGTYTVTTPVTSITTSGSVTASRGSTPTTLNSFTISVPTISTGTFVPTFSVSVGDMSFSNAVASYSRIGNTVNVWGYVLADINGAGGDEQVLMTLPINSTFTDLADCGGVFSGTVNPNTGINGRIGVAGSSGTAFPNNCVLSLSGSPTPASYRTNFSYSYTVK